MPSEEIKTARLASELKGMRNIIKNCANLVLVSVKYFKFTMIYVKEERSEIIKSIK